eukprot:12523008-Alexandrium_andersonii.AAC.1
MRPCEAGPVPSPASAAPGSVGSAWLFSASWPARLGLSFKGREVLGSVGPVSVALGSVDRF